MARQRTSRPRLAVFLAAAGALLVGACSSSGSGSAANSGSVGATAGGTGSGGGAVSGTISVGASNFAGFAAAFEIPKLSNTRGVTVKNVSFPSSSDRGTALLNGNIDMALLGWTQIAELAAKGQPIVVIASNFEKGRTLVARKGSNIHSVKDLVGKKVGYTVGSMVELDVHSELAAAGISFSSVKAVNVDFNTEVLSLAHGDLDAYYGSEPQSAQNLINGTGYLVQYPYDTPYGDINGALVTTKKYLDGHQALVKAYLQDYVEATKTLNSDKSALSSAIATMIGSKDQKVIDQTIGNLALSYSLDGYTPKVQALIDAEKRLGLITTSPTVDSFVDSAPLTEATQ